MVQGPRSVSSRKRPKGPGWGLVQWSLVQRPSSQPYGPRPSLQGQGSKASGTRSTVQDPTFEVRAAIQAARTDVHGPSTMPTGAWVNSKGQGSEQKAPVPSFLRPRDQDAAPWSMVLSPATERELPSRVPELNPVENIWQYMRANWSRTGSTKLMSPS